MDQEILYHRRRFNTALEPIKVMLVDKRRKLTLETWLSFVNQTRDSVLHHPDQYLGGELPNDQLLRQIVADIFTEFMKAEA